MSPADLIGQTAVARESALESFDQDPADQEPVAWELTLLIREARRRQRRRRTARAVGTLAIAAGSALAVLAVAGAEPGHPARGSLRSAQAAGSCPASSARFVTNSSFAATVLGRGAVRLGIGNVYLQARRRVVLGTTGSPAWWAIEAIWIRQPGHSGTLTVRGVRLNRPGPIDVGSSDAGESPGSAALSLPPESANTAPGGVQLYPAVIWVRSGGCYALTVHGRDLNERIVFAAQPR